MAEETQAPEEVGTGTGKKKMFALIAVIVIVLMAGGGIAFWWKKTREELHAKNKSHATKDHVSASSEEEEEEDNSDHPPEFMPIERIVVKLHRSKTSSVDHYLQVALHLKLADHKVGDKIKNYLPVIQHEIMLILSAKEFEWLDDGDHKKKLALEIRDKVNKIVKAPTPKEGVKAVYFSSFIVQ